MTTPAIPIEYLTVDAEQPRVSADQRPIVPVAVGILSRPDGQFLMTSRPTGTGKPYAGYWEFPGGKLEAGETVEEALRRELQEEIGITIAAAHPWRELVVDYPHTLVRLHCCRVYQWQGQLHMYEGQSFTWTALPPTQISPILPAAIRVLEHLQQEITQASSPIHP